MAKLIQIALVVCSLIATSICGDNMEKYLEQKKQIRKICLEKFDVSTDLLDGLSAGSFPEGNKDLKCYVGCAMEEMKIMKDGKFDKTAAIGIIDSMVPENARDSAKQVLNGCIGKSESITDSCELAWELSKCLNKEAALFKKSK